MAVRAKGAPAPAPSVVAADERLLAALRVKREDFDSEVEWHRFLLDAYAGTGGFAGRVKQPLTGFWGAAAEMYSRSSNVVQDGVQDEVASNSYLDRYPREDAPKFRRRLSVAHYLNFVEPIVDLRLSYLARKPMSYEDFDELQSDDKDAEESFFENSGSGMPWERLMRDVVRIRASILGWTPVLFDMPVAEVTSPDGEMSVEQARELGIKPRAIPLWPANLLDWCLDEDGDFVWVKQVTSYTERPDPLGAAVKVERYTIWTRTDAKVWEAVTDEKNSITFRVDGLVVPHAFGRVPIVIFRCRPRTVDPIRGVSMIGSIAPLVRRLFNYTSELDEHLRASTFAMLQMPTKNTAQKGATVIGAGNALPIPHDATRDYKWLSPDGAVADVYENRIKATIEAIYQIARSRFMGGTETRASASGIAQAYEFEDLNRAIADSAASFAASEQEALRLVLVMNGISVVDAKGRVVPPTKFDVEELSKQIDEAMRAVSLELGPTANGEIKKRLVRQLLPNAAEVVLKAIDGEIESAEEEAQAQADAFAEAGLAALASGEADEAEVDAEGNPVPVVDPAGERPVPGKPPPKAGSPKRTKGAPPGKKPKGKPPGPPSAKG